MEFHCRVATPTGETLEGTYVADDEAQLRRSMEDKGLLVLSLRQRGALGWPSLSLPSRRRVRTHEFTVFNQELATLLRAGMPLVQSLDILRQRVENPTFKGVLDDVHEQVRGGVSLSEAFEAHGELFPGVYTACLMAGEKSGGLEEVLRRFVSYSRIVAGVRRRTISALIYPAILLALSVIVRRDHRAPGGAGVLGLLRRARGGAPLGHASDHVVSGFLRQHLLLLAARGRRGRGRRPGRG